MQDPMRNAFWGHASILFLYALTFHKAQGKGCDKLMLNSLNFFNTNMLP
jgi:hypothetical protein